MAISSALSEGSSLNLVMPMLRSMCHGGIWRKTTFSLIERAQGRASLYVSKDIGAIDPGRWQFWHERSKMGAMSLLNVTGLPRSALHAVAAAERIKSSTRAKLVIPTSSRPKPAYPDHSTATGGQEQPGAAALDTRFGRSGRDAGHPFFCCRGRFDGA